MKIEVFRDYDEEENGIGEPEFIEVRKPFPREIWKIQNLDQDNIESEESFEAVAGLVKTVTMKAPAWMCDESGKLDADKMPADIWFRIFRISAKSTLAEAKKLNEI